MLRFIGFTLVLALVACSKSGAKGSKAAGMQNMPTDPIEAADWFIKAEGIDKTKADWRLKVPEPPQFTFDPARTYFWVIETNLGTIKLKLLPQVAPMHVSSTIYLARLGFYDGLVFHRVIPGFVVQGGDPLGEDPVRKGQGGPGYRYLSEADETVIKHDRPGLLSMACTPRPRSDGSQFFITLKAPLPRLDGKHTIFGEVVEGMETVRELEKRGSEEGATSERLVMTKTTIVTQ